MVNAAARVVTDTQKFDRGLTTLLHDKLHWLDVPERVIYKLGIMMYGCTHGQAPRYLADHITPASVITPLRQLQRSLIRDQLTVAYHLVVDSTQTGPTDVFNCQSDGLG